MNLPKTCTVPVNTDSFLFIVSSSSGVVMGQEEAVYPQGHATQFSQCWLGISAPNTPRIKKLLRCCTPCMFMKVFFCTGAAQK